MAHNDDDVCIGRQIASDVVESLESLLTDWALDVVNSLARARRVTPYHAALQVPGLCHTHLPDARIVDGCAYCARAARRRW